MGHDQPGRRSFMAWAVTGLGAVFAAILGAPVVAYVIDPRHRKGAGGDYRVVDTVPLAELRKDQPVQGVLRSVRRDGWALHPNDVIGRVWIVLRKDAIPAGFTGVDPSLLEVFTTICPHLGCSVNVNADATTGFTCPCHTARYHLDGSRDNQVAPRGMDALDWQIDPDPANPERSLLLVKYQNFKASITQKEPI